MTKDTGDLVWQRNEPDSPCLAVCTQHPGAGVCIGCFRPPEEIARWARYTPEERNRIRAELPLLRKPHLYAAGARPSQQKRQKRRRRPSP